MATKKKQKKKFLSVSFEFKNKIKNMLCKNCGVLGGRLHDVSQMINNYNVHITKNYYYDKIKYCNLEYDRHPDFLCKNKIKVISVIVLV